MKKILLLFQLTGNNGLLVIIMIKLPFENRPNVKYTWEKDRMQNNTGTSEAYHPAKVLKKEQVSNKKKNIKAGNLIKMKSNKSFIPKYWLGKDKQKISCKEKINVLNENIHELQEVISDIYDEAILIGIDEEQLKDVLLKSGKKY